MIPLRAVIGAYDYVFAENGLVAYKGDQLIAKQSLRNHLGEDRIKEFVNFVLHYVSCKVDCPRLTVLCLE